MSVMLEILRAASTGSYEDDRHMCHVKGEERRRIASSGSVSHSDVLR